ncbi:polyadenylate-specific 3'-exoribonuclease AS [Nakamurella sp. A5-74]|uniref:3'-5' exoribonuclease n=1 Tax=Nakamurella sp. A5-74 TaxID=3158264 RepID=A0AAU8DKM7_9ACTN
MTDPAATPGNPTRPDGPRPASPRAAGQPTSRAPGTAVGRYFYDCEFIEDGLTIELVSIGVVADDGREYYAVSTDFDPGRANSFVRTHVLDKLPSPADRAWRSRRRIRDDLQEFFAAGVTPIELWAWVAAYDHVALAQLWGAMPALPRFIPRFTREIRQFWESAGSPELPTHTADRHEALADARLAMARWQVADRALHGTAYA